MDRKYSLERFQVMAATLCTRLGLLRGEEVFRRIVRTLGEGTRITVPSSLEIKVRANGQIPGPFIIATVTLGDMLGSETARVLMEDILTELGHGERLTVPFISCETNNIKVCTRVCICRENRNKKIQNQFHGHNHRELALLYSLSERQIRRIVNGR